MPVLERAKHDFLSRDRLNGRQEVSNRKDLITWKVAVPDSRLNGQCGTQYTQRDGARGKNTSARPAGSREPSNGGNYRSCLLQTRAARPQEARGRIDSNEEIPYRRTRYPARNQGSFGALMVKKHVGKRKGPPPAPGRWGGWKAQIHPHERWIKASGLTSQSSARRTGSPRRKPLGPPCPEGESDFIASN
jgi:hypothetical protein